MNDPVLGELKSDPRLPGCVFASIPYQGRSIELRVDPDDVPIEECLSLARGFVASLENFETKARVVASQKLLGEYSQNWREFSRTRSDGNMERVVNPALDSVQFSQQLILESIAVTGSVLEFCFGDNRLFAGHSIFVTSFDGAAFTDVAADLFG